MIDLHSHVLPGIDDGPSDLQGSLDLLAAAEADGTDILAATPHLRHDFPDVRTEDIAPQCVRLNQATDSQLRVVPGGEVDLVWAQSVSDDELKRASYWQRGSDLLVETPYGPLVGTFEDLIFRLSAKGYRILLAHPERNPTFQRDPGRLAALVQRGVLVQLTAQSLASTERRSRSRELATRLVEEDLAHVIASDAHRAREWRTPQLSVGIAAAGRVAPLRARWMVTDAPAAILEGERLPQPPADTTRRRVWPRRRPRL